MEDFQKKKPKDQQKLESISDMKVNRRPWLHSLIANI